MDWWSFDRQGQAPFTSQVRKLNYSTAFVNSDCWLVKSYYVQYCSEMT